MIAPKGFKSLLLLVVLLVNSVVFSQEKATYTISILSDRENDKTEELLTDLKREITRVVKQDIEIKFLDILVSNSDLEKAKTDYRTSVSVSDITLVFGALHTKAIFQLSDYPKPTIVFSGVNKDILKIQDGKTTSGIKNLTFLIPPQSYSEDLDAFKAIYDYQNVGILVDETVYKNLPIKGVMDNYFNSKNESYKLISLGNMAEFDSQLEGLDAVYLTGGLSLSDSEFSSMVSAISSRKLPSFSSFGNYDLNRGILATNQPDSNLEQYFRRIGLTVESIIDGKNPSELPMYIDYKNILTINTNVAEDIDFNIKYSLIGTADFVGGEEKITQPNALSILDVIDGVVKRNLDLQTVQKDVELADQDLSFSKSSYYPNVNAGVNALYTDPELAEINPFNREFVTDGTVTAEQLIYSQEASTNVRVQREALEVQRQVYSASELDAVLNATIAYFNALVLKTNSQIQNQNLQVTKKNLQIATENYEAGSAGKSDMLRFKSQLAQDTQRLVEARNGLTQAYNTLNQLLNNPISQDIDIQDAEISIGIFENYNYDSFLKLIDNPNGQDYLIEFLVQEALNNAPELRGIDFNKNILEANYKLNTVGRFIPTLALQGQYNYNFYRSDPNSGGGTIPSVFLDDFYTVGLNLSLPLFQQSQRNINKQTIKIQEDQLAIEQENLELFFGKNVNDLVLELLNQVANIETSKLAEEAAKESLELTQTSYQEGAVPVIQLIDAQTNYLQSQLARATANYAYFTASMQLERTIGYFFLLHSKEENNAFIQRAYQYILNQN